MKKLLSKTSRLKKVLAFVMCSALILGEIPAGIIKADTSDPKMELVASVDERDDQEITLTAKVANVADEDVRKCVWYKVDERSDADVPPVESDKICSDSSMTLDDLYVLWKTGDSPKINDTTKGIRIVSTYVVKQADPVYEVSVAEDYDWKVIDKDAKDEAELEIDSFEGVSVKNASGETSSDGKILDIKDGMKILDESDNDVTDDNGNLPKGDYVVTLTYTRIDADDASIVTKIILKAKYEIEAAGASESSAPAESSSPSASVESSNPSAAPTEAATTQPSEEPPFIAPTETPDIGQPPVGQPTQAPVIIPTAVPTAVPTTEPTAAPTTEPTLEPTVAPTVEPTAAPATEPTVAPVDPTKAPAAEPTAKPAADPTEVPVADSTEAPEAEPTASPETDKTVTVGKAEFKVDDKSQSVAYEGTSSASKNVTIPATVKVNGVSYPVTSVSAGAFKNSSVEKVTLGSNVTTLGKNAFKGCKKLTKVTFGNKVKTVGVSAFEGCTKLKSVSLPTSAKTIGAKAFKGCKKLKKVTVGKAVKKTRKAQILFGSYNQNKTLFAAPESTKVSIGASAFQNCVKLRSVIINSQVTKIGSKTFQHCKELARVLVKSLKLQAVGNNALKGVNNCKISVPTIRLRKYRTLFKNKGQGRKVVIAKA